MENLPEEDNLLENRYSIETIIGNGAYGKVYLVQDRENNNKEYAAKIIYGEEREEFDFNNEIEIFKKLSHEPNLYIIKYISSGIASIRLPDNNQITNNSYLIMEYVPKNNLAYYVKYTEKGFQEKHAKLIFQKILKGIKGMHDKNIAHLDIKMDNIMFDKDFTPKICDFGFATQFSNREEKSKKYVGSKPYASPQIIENRSFNAFQADIYSLGIVLMFMITKKNVLTPSEGELATLLKYKKFKEFWLKLLKSQDFSIQCSEQLRDLISKTIAHKESDRYKSIDEMLKHPWFNDLNDEEKYQKIEEEVYKELLEREIEVKKKNLQITQYNKPERQNNNNDDGNRTIENINPYHFNKNTQIKKIKTDKYIKDFIKINGKFKPYELMNDILDEINDFQNIRMQEDLCFKIAFPNDNDEEEDYDVDDPILSKNSIIEVKLLELKEGEYIIRFLKLCGDIYDYLQNLEILFKVIKKVISSNVQI